MAENLGWRHVQAVLLCLGFASANALRSCMSVAVIAMKDSEYDEWDQAIYNMIQGSFFWSYVAMQIPSGHWVRTGSVVKILALGMFTSSIFNILIPWLATYGYIAVICGRVGMGFCQSCTVISINSLMSRWIPPSESSRLGSVIMNGSHLGTVASMLISGYLAESKFKWPSIFYFFGICGIIWSIAFYFLSADHPSDHKYIGSKETQFIKSSLKNLDNSVESKFFKVPWTAILTSVPLWAVIVATCGHFWGFYLFFNQLPKYMNDVIRFDIAESGAMSALPYGASLLLSFPVSFLADYASEKGATTEMVRKVCATIAMWIPGVGLLILGSNLIENKTIIVGIIVISIGSTCASNCSLLINSIDLCPNFTAPVVAYKNFLIGLISISSPLLFSLIVPDTTSLLQWQTMFYLTATIYIFSNLVFLIFGKAEVQPWNNPDEGFKKSNDT